MPFNGSGTFQRVRNWVADAAANIKIRADFHDSEDDGFAAGLSNCITRDGQSTILQNIPWNGKRITGLGDAVGAQDAATKAQLDAAADDLDDAKVNRAGDTMTGNLEIAKANPSIILKKAATDQNNAIFGLNGDNVRWGVLLGNSAAEAGANAGSDFGINSYDDAGNYLHTPLTINRKLGQIIPYRPIVNYGDGFADIDPRVVVGKNIAGGSLSINLYLNAASTGWNFMAAAAAAVLTVDSGGLNFATDANTGGVGAGGASPGLSNKARLSHSGTFFASGYYLYNGSFWVDETGYTSWYSTTSTYTHYDKTAARWYFTIGGTVQGRWEYSLNALFVGSQGYKPGGGSWADSSDERIKDVLGDFTLGLGVINKLKPVRYVFKGNDTPDAPSHFATVAAAEAAKAAGEAAPKGDCQVPYKNSDHYNVAVAKKEFIGLVAQHAEKALPLLVSKRKGFINGVEVSDLRDIDTSPLLYALINAVKELSAKVEALEAR